MTRRPSYHMARYSTNLATLDAIHTTPRAGDLIVGDDWHDAHPRPLIACDDWHRASFRYQAIPDWTASPMVAVNIEITARVAYRNHDELGGFWLRCIVHCPGDGDPDQQYPGWILCTEREWYIQPTLTQLQENGK